MEKRRQIEDVPITVNRPLTMLQCAQSFVKRSVLFQSLNINYKNIYMLHAKLHDSHIFLLPSDDTSSLKRVAIMRRVANVTTWHRSFRQHRYRQSCTRSENSEN